MPLSSRHCVSWLTHKRLCAIQRPTPLQNNHSGACGFGRLLLLTRRLQVTAHLSDVFFFFFKSASRDARAADQYWHAEVIMGLTQPAQMMRKCCGWSRWLKCRARQRFEVSVCGRCKTVNEMEGREATHQQPYPTKWRSLLNRRRVGVGGWGCELMRMLFIRRLPYLADYKAHLIRSLIHNICNNLWKNAHMSCTGV